ncbi:hypothetical protein [Neptunomonas japonica]|uniref:DUF2845 domain-containing protein n=1 Tax=Neptunomonas japonica JAMM 1380 TaxID=1441457 RepID=A0A7R6PJ54_9GAMM|nr:hypothetical protein [Neptunomonas japonica]BBB30563.1 hypothetical protein NEJAP_2619 [Neptunomonas japonica JAMM 1380]
MRKLLVLLALLVSSQASALRLSNGQLLSSGDELSKVYENLGKPIAKYKAKTRCGSGRTCSVTRMVYRFDGRKWFIDMKSGQVVNIEWTYR